MWRCTGTDSHEKTDSNVCESFFFSSSSSCFYLSGVAWSFQLLAIFPSRRFDDCQKTELAAVFSIRIFFSPVAENHDSTCFLSFRACSDFYAPLGGRLLSSRAFTLLHMTWVLLLWMKAGEAGRLTVCSRVNKKWVVQHCEWIENHLHLSDDGESRVGGMKALIAWNGERIFAQLLPSLHIFSRDTLSGISADNVAQWLKWFPLLFCNLLLQVSRESHALKSNEIDKIPSASKLNMTNLIKLTEKNFIRELAQFISRSSVVVMMTNSCAPVSSWTENHLRKCINRIWKLFFLFYLTLKKVFLIFPLMRAENVRGKNWSNFEMKLEVDDSTCWSFASSCLRRKLSKILAGYKINWKKILLTK